MDTPQFQAGLDCLAQPILPLVRLVQLLFLTWPFATVSEVVAELNEPIETVVRYEEPAKALAPYLDLMGEYQRLKEPAPPAGYTIVDEDLNPLSPMEAIDLWVSQQVVNRELETINSLLCGPCLCANCCTGPSAGLRQEFFEIPLAEAETSLFALPKIDTPDSRKLTAYSDPPLMVAGRAFFDQGLTLCYWYSGWSMILPRGTACPHLQARQACAIYPQRPEVCRRPPIFAYVIDRAAECDATKPRAITPVYGRQEKILAVWDCPYVRRFQKEIAAYAEYSELEPIFKENKG